MSIGSSKLRLFIINLNKHRAVRSLAELKKNERGIIKGFNDDSLSVKLIEMGCLPGTEVSVDLIAPFGDPIAIGVSGYCLSLRKNEAACIMIED
tara:strand:+ start:335240 stop:335521 length:282 start_codon:yes stop_codon:yes gene_type:complete